MSDEKLQMSDEAQKVFAYPEHVHKSKTPSYREGHNHHCHPLTQDIQPGVYQSCLSTFLVLQEKVDGPLLLCQLPVHDTV